MPKFLENLPEHLDLTDAEHLRRLTETADAILDSTKNSTELGDLEKAWLDEPAAIPLMAHVAIKLARSRATLQEIDLPLHLSVVFAVYLEHTRILTRKEHPHGEDFLREKIRQLRWLFSGIADASWSLTVVDDGCPQNSGEIAQNILQDPTLADVDAKVLFLREAIENHLDVVQPMRSTDESRKGGSILLGMWDAAGVPRPQHVILYTDADLSTHLGQAGSLIGPLLNGGADAAIGSRREPTSISIKGSARNLRGKMFIYLWKRLFPQLHELVDTQCGFKAFTAEATEKIVQPNIEKQFAFDIELLLKIELRRAKRVQRIPVAWIDSEAASTTAGLQPYLPMLQSMVQMARHYLPDNHDAEGYLRLIEDLDETSWNRLVDSIPAAIAEREPHSFGDWHGVTAAELRQVASPAV